MLRVRGSTSRPAATISSTSTQSTKPRNRVEQLADSFAAALLMPAAALERFGDWSGLDGDKLVRRLTSAAEELGVTASALRWRLVALDRLDKAAAKAIPEDRLRHNGRGRTAKGPAKETPPSLFSKSFVEVIARAIDEGRVAVRRVSHLLGLSIDDIADLFESHGFEPPYEV